MLKKIFLIALMFFILGCGGQDSQQQAEQPLIEPKILHVVIYQDKGINLASIEWTYVPGATRYKLHVSDGGDMIFDNVTLWNDIPGAPNFITPRTIVGWETGVKYIVYMTAENDREESPPSNEVWFVF